MKIIWLKIRKIYRAYFWNKKWYQRWILNRLAFLLGESILAKYGGWEYPSNRR